MDGANFALFKDQWSSNALEAMKSFEEQLKKEKSPFWQIEMSKLVANKLRQASRFKRYKLLKILSKCSFFCKCLVSSHFTSIHDLTFPRYFVFHEELAWKDAKLSVQEKYIVVCGENASCQLGVPNGSECYEPVRLKITQCRKVCMGTDHTLFLKMTGEVYGCGLVSALTHGSQKKLFEDSSCKYFTEPTMLSIPDNEEVVDIFASDSYSILLTEHYVYVIGSCSFCEKYKCDVSWVSENSKRIITNNNVHYEWYYARIFVSRSSISIGYNDGQYHRRVSEQSLDEHGTSKYENCGGVSSEKKESLTQFSRQLHDDPEPESEVFLSYKDGVTRKVKLVQEYDRIRTLRCDGVRFHCHICLNGKFIKNKRIEKFVVSPEGNIFVQFGHGFLAKGMVKLMKKEEQFSNGPLSDSHSDFKFAAVIIIDEVPSSYGLTTFSASPDCKNLVMKFGSGRGYRHQKTRNSESTNHKIYWDLLFESIENEAMKEPNEIFPNDLMENTLEEVIRCRNEWEKKFPETGIHSVFLEIRLCFQNLLECCRLPSTGSLWGTMTDLYARRWRWTVQLSTLEELAVKFKSLLRSRTYPEDERKRRIWHYIFITLRMMKNSLVDDNGEFVEFKYFEGHRTPYLYEHMALDNIEALKEKSHNDQQALSKNEIPLDLNVILVLDNTFKTYIAFKKNEVMFQLMYPQLATKIVSGKIFVNRLEFGFIYNRNDFFETDWVVESIHDMVQSSKIETHRSVSRLTFEKEITDLFPLGTDVADLWTLKTGDGKSVKVHKNLLLLHSPTIRKKMDIDTNRGTNELYLSYTPAFTFDVTQTEEVVVAALRAILDPFLLFKKSVLEVMKIVAFYHEMVMTDAFDNAVDVVFQLAAPDNLPYLHDLYKVYDDSIIDKFVEYEIVFLTGCHQELPSLDLLKKLETKMNLATENKKQLRKYRLPKASRYSHLIDKNDLNEYIKCESELLVDQENDSIVGIQCEEFSEPLSKRAKTDSFEYASSVGKK